MNMLYVLDGNRGKGFGKLLVKYWESQMKELNYKEVMTSTQSMNALSTFIIVWDILP